MNNDDKWIIAIDLDGTTLMEWDGERHSDGTRKDSIHKLNIDAIKKLTEMGHYVIICTGRNWGEAKEIYEMLGLRSYIVNSAGAHIHNPMDANAKEYKYGIDKKVLEEVMCDEKVNENLEAWGLDYNDVFYMHKDSVGELKSRVNNFPSYKIFDGEFDFDPQSGILFFNEEDKVIEDKAGYMRDIWGHEIHFTNWGTTGGIHGGIEINPSKYNKGTSIKKVAELLSINKNNIIAIGDGDNDIELMKATEHSVAMKNAVSNIKSLSKYETELDNNEGGLGIFLKDFFNL